MHTSCYNMMLFYDTQVRVTNLPIPLNGGITKLIEKIVLIIEKKTISFQCNIHVYIFEVIKTTIQWSKTDHFTDDILISALCN